MLKVDPPIAQQDGGVSDFQSFGSAGFFLYFKQSTRPRRVYVSHHSAGSPARPPARLCLGPIPCRERSRTRSTGRSWPRCRTSPSSTAFPGATRSQEVHSSTYNIHGQSGQPVGLMHHHTPPITVKVGYRLGAYQAPTPGGAWRSRAEGKSCLEP